MIIYLNNYSLSNKAPSDEEASFRVVIIAKGNRWYFYGGCQLSLGNICVVRSAVFGKTMYLSMSVLCAI